MMTGNDELFKTSANFVEASPPDNPGEATASRVLAAYSAGLALAASVLAGSLALLGWGLTATGSWWPVLAFMGLAMLLERQTIRLTEATEISVAFLPVTFAAVVYGPLAAAAVGCAGILADFPLSRSSSAHAPVHAPYLRWVVWTSNRALDGALAGLAAQVILGMSGDPAVIVGLATAVATVIVFGVDLCVTSLTLVVRQTGRPAELLQQAAKVTAASIPTYAAVAGLLAYAYLEVAPITAALFFIPALAAHRLLVVSQRRQQALAELGVAFTRLESANLSFATALVATLDARDRYTAGHSTAVANYARDIARELGMTEVEQRLVHLCGLVHDIGKIGLPAGLLEKPGALTPLERRQMEEHSAIGERILSNVDDYDGIAQVVRHHHERVDGAGYPDGLIFQQIPFISRILAVADAYDAMTSDRPYRDALPQSVAQRRLAEASGSQFDPAIVQAFQNVLRNSGAGYTAAARTSEAAAERTLIPVAV